MEVQNINMPEYLQKNHRISCGNEQGKYEEPKETYIYATYLPAGLHSFLIYDPKNKLLYCKDVLVDLSSTYYYPEYPLPFTSAIVKKKTRQNVWRKWREDSEIDIELALVEDLNQKHFEPGLFMKNEIDVERCRQYLIE